MNSTQTTFRTVSKRILTTSLGLFFACAQPSMAAFVTQVLADNPRGFWILNDATTTAVDSSPNLLNGTYGIGVTPQGVAGPSWVPSAGLVASFTGGNIAFPAPLDLGANGYTIQAWIKPTFASLTTTGRIVASGNGFNGYGFGTTSGGGLLFTTFAQKDFATTTVSLMPNEWQYVGVVMDVNNDAHFYLNGVLVETVTDDQVTNPPGGNFTIGDQSPGIGYNDESYTGGLAGISVYDTALTSAQIRAQYDSGAMIPETTSSALIAVVLSAGCLLRQRRRNAGSPVSR